MTQVLGLQLETCRRQVPWPLCRAAWEGHYCPGMGGPLSLVLDMFFLFFCGFQFLFIYVWLLPSINI